jgi:hypothetical protein
MDVLECEVYTMPEFVLERCEPGGGEGEEDRGPLEEDPVSDGESETEGQLKEEIVNNGGSTDVGGGVGAAAGRPAGVGGGDSTRRQKRMRTRDGNLIATKKRKADKG